MKINVTRIPDEGLEIDFSEKEGWLQEKLHHTLAKEHQAEDKIWGHFSIYRSLHNIQVKAQMHLPIHATCARCLQNYVDEIDVKTERYFTPLFDSKRQREIEKKLDVEVTLEDFQFSYYEGEEIDVGNMLVEQAVLDQPMIYLCRQNCKGLCPHCGANLNEKSCECKAKHLKESPFAVLKKWKKELE